VFRKRFALLRKCALSLQVMCLWLLARRRACVTLQHAFRCHSSRGKMVQLVEQRAALISKFLRRRRTELVNPSFRVVSLHTAKEVSELYTHSKTAAELESERRPWRRLKRTALRDAEALAESVIGIPAEDLRRRFRGVIGRRVLVTLSSIASADDRVPELQNMLQSSHASDAPPAPPDAPAGGKDATELVREAAAELPQHMVRSSAASAARSASCVPSLLNALLTQENRPPPAQAQASVLSQSQPDSAAADEKQSAVARFVPKMLKLRRMRVGLSARPAGTFISKTILASAASGQRRTPSRSCDPRPATPQVRPSTLHGAPVHSDCCSGGSALWTHDNAEGLNFVGASQPAVGRVVRDGQVGAISKPVSGTSMPQELVAQRNLPRVIQLPKQILLHLEVCRTLQLLRIHASHTFWAGNSQNSRIHIRGNIDGAPGAVGRLRSEYATQNIQPEHARDVAYEGILGL
jgi:hypothetical protein